MPSLELLIAQILTILIAARLIGWLFRKINQPRVIGEMVAGILLGPSLFGWVAPDLHATLFPPASLGYLSSLSYVGLLLFMFLVGLELDLKRLRELGRAAVITSQVSIVLPFAFGSLFALYLYPRLSDPHVSTLGFVLFMGAAMSVTAFPVLARILAEHRMLQTRVGSVAITCAAVDDVTAWCILAGIIVIVRSSSSALPLWLMLTGLGAFVLVMLFVVRRSLISLKLLYEKRGGLTADTIAIIFLLVLTSSLITESLGIHALFGAFLAGVVMPRHPKLSEELSQKLEAVVVVLLLPLYFALTGLRSSIFLISGARMWFYAAVIIVLAVAGKWGGSMISARINGMTWRESAAVGVLMNTRGLVELVILNIGLDLGILSPALFSIMVLMALVTTLMTTPLLNWILRSDASNSQIPPRETVRKMRCS
ncbi:MAG TPA: cation:proton antiporter [Blastocatellia bacterium]|nr:cation:proton antiporter [Blastocatellia bacterium]